MKTSRLMRSVMAATLAALLAVPAAAMAAGPLGQGMGNGNSGGKGKGAGQGQQVQTQQQNQSQNQARADRLRENLRNRIERTLKQRKAKFDRAEARLKKRIARLTEIADKAAGNGVDVHEAEEALAKATGTLATAADAELTAQGLFRAVPDAPDKDRRAAFAAARAQAKVAQKALQRARLDVVSALKLLHTAIDAAKTTTP